MMEVIDKISTTRMPKQKSAVNKVKSDSVTQAQEVELVTRVRQGDAAALEQLYYRYFDRLYSLVYNQVGRNHGIAEDIVQETFLAVLKSASKFRGQSKLYTWLCSIAYHKVTDFHRRQERIAKHGDKHYSLSDKEPGQISDNDDLPTTSKIESEETRQVVEQALLSLPVDYQQVLIFKYVEEMSVLDISQAMHRSPKSVEGLLTRARKTLRAYLVQESEGKH
jgi:RNA polymerase sigma-70 factor (ECF subfamily)